MVGCAAHKIYNRQLTTPSRHHSLLPAKVLLSITYLICASAASATSGNLPLVPAIQFPTPYRTHANMNMKIVLYPVIYNCSPGPPMGLTLRTDSIRPGRMRMMSSNTACIALKRTYRLKLRELIMPK